MKRRDFCKSLAIAAAAGMLPACPAAQAAQTVTALVGKAVPDGYYSLRYRSDRGNADLEHACYYSESLFDHPATEYDNQLALVTLGMAMAAACTWESNQRYWMTGEAGRADNIRDAFAKLGYAEVELFNWEHSLNDTPDTVGCAIARKTLVRDGKRVTIIAAFLRGAGYGAEWSSNFHTGGGTAHTGFVAAARQLTSPIRDYVDRMAAKRSLGTLKFWMSGFSRSAAVANLLAARLPSLLPRLSKENTYVYTFATPAALTAADCPDLRQDYDNNHRADGTLKATWGASNIFSIISSGDLVPRVLPAAWGFHRNGNDRFLPATKIPEELEALGEQSTQTKGAELAFDQLAVAEETDEVVAGMMDLFESRQNYHEVYEPVMRCIMQCVNTHSEAEVTQGVVLDDAAVVERLCGMDGMKQFSREEIERCVQAASAMSRPLLEKQENAVPTKAQQMLIPTLAVGLCFNMDNSSLLILASQILSMFTEEGQLSGTVRAVLCHLVENYFTLLEYYAPEDHGMEPYTRL